MALDWNNPDPNSHEYWDDLAKAFTIRRIEIHSPFRVYGDRLVAGVDAPFYRANTFGHVYDLLKIAASSLDDGFMWMNADGTKMMWRDVVAAAPLIAQLPCRGMGVKDSFLVDWMKDCVKALKCFRYKFGTVSAYGTDAEGHYSGQDNSAAASIAAAIAHGWAEQTITKDAGAGESSNTLLASKYPGDYIPAEYANKWKVSDYSVGRIRACAPCPWAVPATMKLRVDKPVWVHGDGFVADVFLFDAMGTGWTEGWNTFPTPDPIRQILNSFPATPPAPTVAVGSDTSLKIGWRVVYDPWNSVWGSALYDYGDVFQWTQNVGT